MKIRGQILNSLKWSLDVRRDSFRFHSGKLRIKPRPKLDTCSLWQLHWTGLD